MNKKIINVDESVIGTRVLKFDNVETLNKVDKSSLREISTCCLNDVMGRLYGMASEIKLINSRNAAMMIGPACTIKTAPGDTLKLHQAISDMDIRGYVIVVDAFGDTSRAVGGEIVLTLAQLKGAAGVVVNGLLRDRDGISRLSMPVYALGTTNIGPWKNGPGEINVPVSCGGQVVRPGDFVVGDRDGVVVIPLECVSEVGNAARQKKQFEDNLLAEARNNPLSYIERVESATYGYSKNMAIMSDNKEGE